jgi:hypothetical protein
MPPACRSGGIFRGLTGKRSVSRAPTQVSYHPRTGSSKLVLYGTARPQTKPLRPAVAFPRRGAMSAWIMLGSGCFLAVLGVLTLIGRGTAAYARSLRAGWGWI